MRTYFLICLLLTATDLTKAAPSAVISYINSPYRSNAGIVSVNFVGTSGGVYTSTLGLSIDSLTGAVNTGASTSGNYKVTYTIAAQEGFGQYQTTAVITIYYFSNAPNLGTAANFVLFTIAGAVGNTGISQITGNVGTNVGAITGFGTSVTGFIYTPNTITVQCSTDLLAAYTQLNNTVPTSTTHTPAFGSGETLFAGVYSIAGAGSVAGNLTLDAQGNPNAVFIFKFDGAFTTGASTMINLVNGATACNVFWKAEGAISMAALTTMKGTLIANNGAISMGAGGILEGRMFSTTGAASVYAVSASLPTCFSVATWAGTLSTAWDTAGNWLYGEVPTTTTNVIIPGGLIHYPLLNDGISSAQNIIIQSNASLTVTGGTFQISGSINDSGTFDLSGGTLEMNGLSPQTIPANTFVNNNILNLVISNNVTLAGQQNLLGKLTFAGSNDTLNSLGFLTLRSTVISTAMVSDITNGGTNTGNSISGNVTVERYIPALRSWRLMTAPLTSSATIFNSWQNGGIYSPGMGTFVSGPVNGSGMDKIGNPSMYTYVTATQTFNTLSNTNVNISAGNNGSADNTGYMIFIRGDRNLSNYILPNDNNTTLSCSGKLQTGAQVFNAATVSGKYTLIGDPYASPIDFNNVIRTNLVKRFYAWDPTLNTVGAFVVLDDLDGDGVFSSSIAGSAQGKDIQSGQAVLVQTLSNGTASLEIDESSKSIVNNNLVFRPASVMDDFRTDLYLLNVDSSLTLADGTYAQFDNNFLDTITVEDAPKLSNTNENLSFEWFDKSFSIERRPLLSATDTLSYKLAGTTQRSYRFNFTANNPDRADLTGILIDNYSGTNTPINLNGVTPFDFTITANPASASSSRFLVFFRPSFVLPVTFSSISAYSTNAIVNVSWKVANQINIIKYEVERSEDGKQFNNVAILKANTASVNTYNWMDKNPVGSSDFYRILSIDNDGNIEYSQTIQVIIGSNSSGISVYPNPIVGSVINLQMNNMPVGIYKIRLLGNTGQIINVSTINHTSNKIEEILLNNTIAKGVYQLELTQSVGKKVSVSILCE